MQSPRRWPSSQFVSAIFTATLAVGTVSNALAQAVEEHHAPPELSSVSVPQPSSGNLSQFIKNESQAKILGKALFWDMAVGSDGVACASCHFHAGADNRTKNQLNPGTLRVNSGNPHQPNPDNTFQTTASGGQGGPNYTLKRDDFPFHQFNDPDNKHSGVKFTTNDIASSQGTFSGDFQAMPSNDQQDDICDRTADPFFHVGGIGVRRVEPRNTPSVINSVFNFRTFWDGRANNVYNGVDPFGKRNENARVFRNDGAAVMVDLRNASLASLGDGPPLSDFEMSCRGRTLAEVGKKMIDRKALAYQKVHSNDSVLGSLRDASSGLGLNSTYKQLIKNSFQDVWWNSNNDFNGYSQMEANFSLFFGLAVNAYQKTLISDEAPYDYFAAFKSDSFDPSHGFQDQLTSSQRRGLDVFLNQGKCINCHKGSEFSGAASVLQKENEEDGLVERMHMNDGGIALYDNGFYNIGVTPTHDDIGVGARDPFGNPLSFTEQYVNNDFVDPIGVDECEFEVPFFGSSEEGGATSDRVTFYRDYGYKGGSISLRAGRYTSADLGWLNNMITSLKMPSGWKVTLHDNGNYSGYKTVRYSGTRWLGWFNDRASSLEIRDADGNYSNCTQKPSDISGERVAVNGAFKTPILRNVELTGPYMHNGSMATLDEVVEFYNRGGNFSNTELAPDIQPLGLSSSQKTDLVAFLKSLTDPRVKNEEAPFDHPQLIITDGHKGDESMIDETHPLYSVLAADSVRELPAVGAQGRSAEGLEPLKPFLDLVDPEISDVNIAQGKTAKQASNYGRYYASRSVDGNASTDSHTSYTHNSWWQVDLGSTTTVGRVKVNQRHDGRYAYRLSDYHVFVSTTDMTGRSYDSLKNDANVWKSFVAGQSPTVMELDPMTEGRYVRIQLSGRNYLSFSEVEVFGVVEDEVTTTTPTPTADAITCATENGHCSIPAGNTATVWYGANSSWALQTGVTGSISCNNATFGDPIPGTAKSCQYQVTDAPTADPWVQCAEDGGICYYSSESGSSPEVRFVGTNGQTATLMDGNGTWCLPHMFGLTFGIDGVCEYRLN